jgi:hypothetical protein
VCHIPIIGLTEMNRDVCIEIIYRETTEVDGFLVQLREGKFAQQHFEELLAAMHQYREIVRGQESVDRLVVICLYYLNVGLLGALTQNHWPPAERTLVQRADETCSQLIIDIYTPESQLGTN